jgi:hypothetical protein
MPIYNVSLSVTRPPTFSDDELVDLLRQAANRAACRAIEVAPGGMVIECEAASLDRLELVLRVNLGANGGALQTMTARPI